MSISAFRIFFRIEKLGKIPHFGNTGFTYVTPISQGQRYLLSDLNNGLKNNKTIIMQSNGGRGGFISGVNRRFYSSVTTGDIQKSDDARGAPKKKPKTLESPKIMLISETRSISTVTLEEAGKIAARKGLNIVPVDSKLASVKTERPVYRLITNAEFMALEKELDVKDVRYDKEDKKKEREVKHVMMKSKIAEHDALSKTKQMAKWIEKGYPVRVIIGQSGDKGDAESVYKIIETHMKDSGARFLQKVVKGEQIRFHLMPPKEVKPSKKSKRKDDTSSSDSEANT